jgi:molybdopterin converting factor small subunit
MARLRLFANLREAAGTGSVEFDAASVADLLTQAEQDFGPVFAAGLAHARVWVNGEPADAGTVLAPTDEVALIPPVSGGALVIDAEEGSRLLLAAALVVALLLASTISLQAFVVALVAVAGVWLWDLAGYTVARGVALNAYPLFVAVVAPAWGAYRWGFEGFAFATVVALAATLVWALFRPEFRAVDSLAASGLVVVLVAVGVGSMVLIRLRSTDELTAFVVVIGAAVLAGWFAALAERRMTLLDPNIAALAGAIIAGAIAGTQWGPGWNIVFVASVVAAAGLVAGRAIGSLLRSGQILLVDPPPGYLAMLDGPFLAAGLFWLGLALLT